MIWDTSDANPMHRRIPGEVISRRRPEHMRNKPTAPTKKEGIEEVVVDLKAAITLKPEARPTWLRKACKMVVDGKAASTELYNIVVSRKFAAGLPERVSRRLVETIKDSMELFSDKQRRYLKSSDCPLMASQKREDREVEAEDKAEEKVEEDKADEEKDADETAGSPLVERKSEKPEKKEKGEDEVSKARVFLEQRATLTFDSLREERQRDREAERARERERDRERDRARTDPSANQQSAGSSTGAKWQAALDEAAQRRHVADAFGDARKEGSRGQPVRKFGKDHLHVLDNEVSKKNSADNEAATRKKLEEEADDLLMNALLPREQQQPPSQQQTPAGNGRPKERRRSRSRSISSRTARRIARKNKTEKSRPADWRKAAPGDYLTGSRALLMNKEYTEDLPHLPRPANAPPVGRARFKSRSRSATRFF